MNIFGGLRSGIGSLRRNGHIGSRGRRGMKSATRLAWQSLALLMACLLTFQTQASTILSNGTVSIGINDQGNLIYRGIGLTYVPTHGEALAPGCPCEGWGAADLISRKWGKAGESFRDANIVVDEFTTSDNSAKSVVRVVSGGVGAMRVTHDFTESVSANLYQAKVTIENITEDDIQLRYRRAMDWDVPPTTFSELVTIVTNGATDVVFSSDNGFADGNPLNNAGRILFQGEATDSGPTDHGAVFDFDFGLLGPGKKKEFVIYYGAAKNQDEALLALATVGAEIYSLGKPNPSHYAVDIQGNPNTFIFGFGGVGGKPLALPDFTLGGLAVNDNGLDQPLALTARVANAGHTESAVAEDVDVAFYDGDPAAGGILLGSVTVPSLAPGHYQDVRLDGIDTLLADEVVAVVDGGHAVLECNESNNDVSIAPVPATVSGAIAVASDAPSYGAFSAAVFSAEVTNPGRFDYHLKARLRLEDADGGLIQSFPERDLGVVAAGATSAFTEDWNTADYLAGSYRLVGVLYALDGSVQDESSAGFAIGSGDSGQSAASLRITADRAQYNINDSVEISGLVRNLTDNVLVDGARLQITVTGPDGQPVLSETLELGQLAPGAERLQTLVHTLQNAPVGNYQVDGELLDSNDNPLASDSAAFEVVQDPDQVLSGDVTAQYPQRYIGEQQICTDSVTNNGNLAIADLDIRRLLSRLDVAGQIDDIAGRISLEPGETETLVRSVSTAGLSEGDYACVLQAWYSDAWNTLDYDTFRLDVPPIEAGLSIGVRGRVLVLLDVPPQGSGPDGGDPHGNDPEPTLEEQQAYLEELLGRYGWSYTIVTDKDDFAAALHSGGYNSHLLLAEQEKLDESVQDELREAVYRGDGLVLAGGHDQRHHGLQEALGIVFKGKHAQATGVDIDTSVTIGQELFGFDDNALHAELAGAEVLGIFTGTGDDPAPVAFTGHEYGWGKSVYGGFDLLAQATEAGGENLFSALVLDALDRVQPAEPWLTGGAVVPIRLTLTSAADFASVQVRLALPEAGELVDPGDAELQDDGSLLWTVDLGAGQDEVLRFWVRLPQGTHEITAEIVSGQSGVSDTLTLEMAAAEPLGDVVDLAALLESTDSGNVYLQVRQSLERAQNWLEKGDSAKALDELLKATEPLRNQPGNDAAELRRAIDRQIWHTALALAGP